MKTDKLNLGFLTSLSGRWPRELPNQRLEQYSQLIKETYPTINPIMINSIVADKQALKEAINTFKTNSVDLVLMMYGAFTGDDVSVAIAEELNVPIVLWAPKEPKYEGGRLLANALVAATMNSASLKRLGHKVYVVYGDYTDERVMEELNDIIYAYDAVKKIKGNTLGLFGYRPTAFYNSAFDEALTRKVFGVKMESTDLKMVFNKMESFSDEEVQADMAKVEELYGAKDLPEGHLENHSRLYLALKETMKEQGYDYATIKCWPEMGNLKTTPCAVLGRLADEGVLIGCEGDVEAMLATIIQNVFNDQPTFITDLIDIDEEANTLAFWHCGNPAPQLIDKDKPCCLGDHPLAGQGTAFYSSLKPGKVTISRLCNIKGEYKMMITRGEAVSTDRNITGTMAKVKIEWPVRDYIYEIIEQGIAHHYSITWDDVADKMIKVAELLGIEVIEL